MRKLCLLLLILLAGSLAAQSGYIQTFDHTAFGYGTHLTFVPKTIYLCSDNSLMILGDASFYSEPQWSDYAAILKLDPEGNLLWSRLIYDPFLTNIIGAGIDDNDGVHFITGRPYRYKIGYVSAIGTLTLQPQHSFESGYYTGYFRKAIRLSSGEIVACGISHQGNYNNAAFCRMSAAGDSLAATYYPPDTPNYMIDTEAVSIAQKVDGSFFLACYLNLENLSILHTDTDGTIIDRYEIEGSNQGYGMSMFLDSDSLSVFSIETGTGIHATKLTSINNSGVINTYILVSELYFLYSVAEASDHFVLLGTDQLGPIRIAKYDNTLQNLWCVWFDSISLYYNSADTIDNLKLDQQGCVYFVGGAFMTSFSVAKLLPNGQVPVLDVINTPAPVKLEIGNYPNPFNPSTTITFSLPQSGNVKLSVYNLRGQKVKTLTQSDLIRGFHKVIWDGKDDSGRLAGSGIYFVRIETGGQSFARKVMMVK
jgi:hypothetical protein